MRSKALLTALGAIALLLSTTPAYGATTPNSCRYSYDALYRDMPVTIDSTASIVPDERYPAPTEVVPGQTLRSAAGTAAVVLPEYLAPFGYAVGLLHAGRNDIAVKVWIAVRATNTKERVQVVGPIPVTASTTITVDPADDNRFLGATPWQYTTPAVPELTWTAVGGDVVFSQDTGGNLPQLPVGTGGALRTVTGSAVIQASFAAGASIYMDCRPGRTTGIEFDFAGPTYEPGPAIGFDTETGPRNTTCLSSLGRLVSGPDANFPAGLNRELDPLQAALATTGAPAQYTVGTPYTLPASTLSATLSTDTMATLGRVQDGGQPLVVADRAYPVNAWVTIAASNTTEGAQTVQASATYTPRAGFDAVALALALGETAWTPTGTGPIRFTLGAPGASASTGPTSPYGSVFLSLGTERDAVTLDCAPAAIRIADSTIPWSDAGRTGSSGRYAFDPNLDTPAFATAVNSLQPPVEEEEEEQPGPGVIPQPTATATPAPTATPKPNPPVAKPPAGRIASTRLTSRGGKVELRISCPSGSVTCRGTIGVRSASKLKLGKRAKIVTLTRSIRYSIAPGKQRTAVLSLSKDGRSAVKRHRTIKARVTLRTSAGTTTTRRVDLRRGR